MKKSRNVRHQSRRPAGASESGVPAAARGTQEAARAEGAPIISEVVQRVLEARGNETTPELDRLLVRLDTEIADEKREMSALLTRLRTRIAA